MIAGSGSKAPIAVLSRGSPMMMSRMEVPSASQIPSNPAVIAPGRSPDPIRFATRGVVA